MNSASCWAWRCGTTTGVSVVDFVRGWLAATWGTVFVPAADLLSSAPWYPGDPANRKYRNAETAQIAPMPIAFHITGILSCNRANACQVECPVARHVEADCVRISEFMGLVDVLEVLSLSIVEEKLSAQKK